MKLNPFGLPEKLPTVTVEPSNKRPFDVENLELRWWFARPVLGEVTSWCCFDPPNWENVSDVTRIECIGRAAVHSIECAELRSEDYAWKNGEWVKQREVRFYVNQTKDFTRTIAAIEHRPDGLVISSFYDEHFVDNWGKENPISITDEGKIERSDNGEYSTDWDGLMVCDRCNVKIGENLFDCVRVFDLTWFPDRNRSILMESFINTDGRTILSRRYNAPYWGITDDGPRRTPWDVQYPSNQRIRINGVSFVHWYDSASHLAF